MPYCSVPLRRAHPACAAVPSSAACAGQPLDSAHSASSAEGGPAAAQAGQPVHIFAPGPPGSATNRTPSELRLPARNPFLAYPMQPAEPLMRQQQRGRPQTLLDTPNARLWHLRNEYLARLTEVRRLFFGLGFLQVL